ncbi:MAG: RNA polymerase sigma factor [Bacteroidia bacterium]
MISDREFESLFNRYFDQVRKYLYFKCSDKDLATDIAQDVFTKVWEKRKQFDHRNIKALLYKMASDQLISHFRKNKTTPEKPFEFDIDTNTPHQQLELKELKIKYETALASLPENQRVVFLMNRIEQLTYKEIAVRLEISVKAIEKRMSGAIKYLRAQLKP